MKVGFVGLGQMGSGMAGNLLKAGHEVTVYNRTAAKAQALAAAGARVAARVEDACRGEAVLTMLADDPALESVAFSERGILATLGEGRLHVSLSTISVALSEKLTAAHAAARQRYVAAPVFGRPDAAAAAQLVVVAAGASAALERCRPLFEAMGRRTFTFGDNPPLANLIKLSGNFLITSVIESLSEALALVSKGGVDAHQYLDLLTSTLFAAPIYRTYGALIADRKFQPAGFAAPLGFKDVRLALEAAEKLRVPLPLGSVIRDRFLALLARGGENLDWSAISEISRTEAGIGE